MSTSWEKKERSFMKSEEAIAHLSNVMMILLLYLKWKNFEVFGKVKTSTEIKA